MNEETKSMITRAAQSVCAWVTLKTGWPANLVKIGVGFLFGGIVAAATAAGLTGCNVTYTASKTPEGVETVSYQHEFAPVTEVAGAASTLISANPKPAN